MTPRSVSFTVFGRPVPKGSARGFVVMKAGKKPRAIVTSDNKNVRAWGDAVRTAAQDVAGEVFFEGAIALHVAFYLQRPRSVKETTRPFMTTKPDLSKLIRSTEDALTEVLWKDDALVIAITASKAYAAAGETSRADITVTEVIPLDMSMRQAPLLERTM